MFLCSGVVKYILTRREASESFNMNHLQRCGVLDSELHGKIVEKSRKHVLRCTNFFRNITPAGHDPSTFFFVVWNCLPALNTLEYVDMLAKCRVSAYWANTQAYPRVSSCLDATTQCLRVEFLLKTESGYSKDMGVTLFALQPLGIPSAAIEIYLLFRLFVFRPFLTERYRN